MLNVADVDHPGIPHNTGFPDRHNQAATHEEVRCVSRVGRRPLEGLIGGQRNVRDTWQVVHYGGTNHVTHGPIQPRSWIKHSKSARGGT